MSTLITYSMELGMPSLKIHAPDSRTVITNTDITRQVIEITGEPKSPFILGVKFVDCTIIAENLRAFDSCYFDQSCTMKVASMPLCGHESINNNAVIIAQSEGDEPSPAK